VHVKPARRTAVQEDAGGDFLAAQVAEALGVGAGEGEVVPWVREEGAQGLGVLGALLVQVKLSRRGAGGSCSHGFFISRNSLIFLKFPFYPQGPIKFDIGQIFPFFPTSTQTTQIQPCDGPALIMFYSCFYL
jgi:hypothetical protein